MMNSVYVLIMAIISTEGSTIATAEFDSFVNCHQAGKAFVSMDAVGHPQFSYRCARK